MEFKNKRIPFTVAGTGITKRMYKKPHWQEANQLPINFLIVVKELN